MPFFAFIHSLGRGSFPVRVDDGSIIAVLLKDLVEAKPTAQQMHFAVGNWDIYSCDAVGTKSEPQVALADRAVIAPAVGEPAVHLWVEPKTGAAAGEPLGSWKRGGWGIGVGAVIVVAPPSLPPLLPNLPSLSAFISMQYLRCLLLLPHAEAPR
jgi:hypothetical protein